MNTALALVLALPVFLFSSTLVLAQSRATSADLSGTVQDESGGVLAGVPVTATNQSTGVARTAESTAEGRFLISALPPGTYTLAAIRTGFATLTVPDVVLTIGSSIEITLEMVVAGVVTHVTVAASRRAIDVPRSAVTSLVSQQQIDALPTNDRAFIGFALTTPGVATDTTPQQGASRTSGLTFAGQRARSNNITVDGLDNNDETVGSVRALFSQEAVREFQVFTNSFPAEFGKATGGIVNVVTRSGTNAYAGNVFGFFRDKSLSAKGHFERFDPAGRPLDGPKAPFSRAQFGGVLGGPIKRNRAFFFGSFERLDSSLSNFVTIDDVTLVRSPVNPAVVLGTPAGILRNAGFPVDVGNVPYDVRANAFLGKADLQLSSGHSLSVRLNTASELNENIEPFGGQVAKSRAAVLDSHDVMGAMTDTLVMSASTLNELRVQIAGRNQIVRSLDPRCNGACDLESQGGPTLEVTSVASVGRQRFTPTPRDNTRYQIVDTLSHYRGRHQLKAGIDTSFIQGRRQALPLHFGGRYIFPLQISVPLIPGQPAIPISSIQAVALGLPAVYVQGYGNSGAAYDTSDLSLFAQDEWRPTTTVTINAGVRYQKQFWQDDAMQVRGYPNAYTFPSDSNNLAPRVGFTWSAKTPGRAIVHAAYGLFHDNVITSVYGISEFINGTDGVRTLVLQGQGAFAAWAAPGHHLDEASALQLLGHPYPSVQIAIDPGFRTPSAHHVSAGIAHDLSARWSVDASAVYVRGRGQLGTVDYNPVVPTLGPGRRPEDVNGVAGTSASVLQYTSFGETWYRGLAVGVAGRFNGASQVRVSYTLSDAKDNSTDFQSAFLPQNNGLGRNPRDLTGLPLGFDPESERGPSGQDERHRLSVSGVQELGHGFQIAGIVTAGSGRPYNILAGSDLNGDGDGGSFPTDRPRRVPGDPSTSVGRNAGRLPGTASVDLRASKRFSLGGRITADLIVDVFNVFNRTNFTDIQPVFGTGSYPDNPSPTYGQFTQAGAPRQAQLGLKLAF